MREEEEGMEEDTSYDVKSKKGSKGRRKINYRVNQKQEKGKYSL